LSRHTALARLLCAVLALAASRLAESADTPLTRLFDTGSHAPAMLPADAVARRAGWKQVPEETKAHAFAGDAAFLNDKLTVLVRPKSGTIDVYAATATGPKHRATLGHVGTRSSGPDAIRQLTIADNSPAAVELGLAVAGGPPASLQLRITAGEPILKMSGGKGAFSIDVLTKCSHVVVPEFFADDLVFGRKLFKGQLVPADSLLLSLIDGGEAIVAGVCSSPRQDVWLGTAGGPKGSELCSARITCAEGQSLWLAFLERPGLWHGTPKLSDPAHEGSGWKPPFPARWRCSLNKHKGIAASWSLQDGPKTRQIRGRNEGPLVVYPIDRTRTTPLNVYCPIDVLRNTLGVGPCQYILAAEGLASDANPTPDQVMAWAGRQLGRKRRPTPDAIRGRLDAMAGHLARQRGRIGRYRDLAARVRQRCSEGGALPDHARELPRAVDWLRRLADEGTAETAALADLREVSERIVALADKPNAREALAPLTARVRAVGAAHDRALARCRTATRWLRQTARMLAVAHPDLADLAKAVQQMTEQMLWGHEKKPAH